MALWIVFFLSPWPSKIHFNYLFQEERRSIWENRLKKHGHVHYIMIQTILYTICIFM